MPKPSRDPMMFMSVGPRAYGNGNPDRKFHFATLPFTLLAACSKWVWWKAGVPNPWGGRPLPVCGLLATRPYSRRWAPGERAKLHLPPPVARITTWAITTTPILWKNCLPRSWSLVPERLGTADVRSFGDFVFPIHHIRIWYCFLEYPISNTGEYLCGCDLYRSLCKTITLASRTQCTFRNNITITNSNSDNS